MACHILKPCLSISYISSPWCSFISPMFSNLSSLVALRVRSGTACLLSCHRKKAELGLGTPSKPREVTTSSIKTSCLLEISGCYMFFYIDFTFFCMILHDSVMKGNCFYRNGLDFTSKCMDLSRRRGWRDMNDGNVFVQKKWAAVFSEDWIWIGNDVLLHWKWSGAPQLLYHEWCHFRWNGRFEQPVMITDYRFISFERNLGSSHTV